MKDSFFKDDPYIGVNHDKVYAEMMAKQGTQQDKTKASDLHNPNSQMDIQLFIHDPEPKFVRDNKDLIEE